MIKAILFDLDDTLIQNSAEVFVGAYVQKLGDYLHQHHPNLDKRTLQQAILQATQVTLTSTDPYQTNVEVFSNHFSMLTKLSEQAFVALMEGFYRDEYPKLKPLIGSIPSAPLLVQWLFDHQYLVAVATNPLLPQESIYQRLGWGGLSRDDYAFNYITTLENMHFTKPHPHYYEELLTWLGVEPDEALMVGDDWANDILPASQAGLNTFWIYPNNQKQPTEPSLSPDGVGTFEHLAELIMQKSWLDTLQPRPLTAEQMIPRMLGNIAALMSMAKTTPAHYWQQNPDPKEWSPIETVLHLRDSESSVQRPRLERILHEDNPFLVPPSTPPAPGTQDLSAADGVELVHQFAAEREKTIQLLAALPQEAWTRPARHSIFGPTSLLEMAAFTARHDRLHIDQFWQTVGKCK